MNNKNKHFVVDIDGCITDGKGKPINLQQIQILANLIKDNNLSFSLCTGRSAPYVEAICQMLDLKDWCICENGAYIYYPSTDQIEYHPLVTEEVLIKLQKLKQTLISEKYRSICKIEPGKEVCLSFNPINGASIEALYENIKPLLGDTELYINHSASAVDITPAGVDKGTALQYIAGKTDLNLQEVVAIGDSEGDFPFMKVSGFKACPINATLSLSGNSDYISQYASTKGVADIVNLSDRYNVED